MSARKYRFRVYGEGENWMECAHCLYPAPLSEFKLRPNCKKWLCELCANSVDAGSAVSYPSLPRGDDNYLNLLRSVFHVGNAILDTLGKFATAESEEAPEV